MLTSFTLLIFFYSLFCQISLINSSSDSQYCRKLVVTHTQLSIVPYRVTISPVAFTLALSDFTPRLISSADCSIVRVVFMLLYVLCHSSSYASHAGFVTLIFSSLLNVRLLWRTPQYWIIEPPHCHRSRCLHVRQNLSGCFGCGIGRSGNRVFISSRCLCRGGRGARANKPQCSHTQATPHLHKKPCLTLCR